MVCGGAALILGFIAFKHLLAGLASDFAAATGCSMIMLSIALQPSALFGRISSSKHALYLSLPAWHKTMMFGGAFLLTTGLIAKAAA
jgi:multisubunit Na+/H+ antiporter MnhB subunit